MKHFFIEAPRHVLTALAIAAVSYVLLRQAKRVPARDVAGNVVLRQPPFYRVTGLVSAGIGVVLLVAILFGFDWGRLRYDAHEQLGFGISMFGALLFLGLSVAILQANATFFTITPLGVSSNGPRGQHTFLLWHDISAVRYNSVTYELKIATPQSRIKAGRYLVGFDLLVEELVNRTGRSRKEMGIPAF